MNGWIKLHRKILEWEWYSDINTRILFIHLLLSANHKDQRWKGVLIRRGQILTGINKLSQQTKQTVQQTRTALNKLKSTNEITIESTNKYSVITICKWDSYQIIPEDNNNQDNNQDNKRTTNEQQTTNTLANNKQEDKNNKNEKNEKKTRKASNGANAPSEYKECMTYWYEFYREKNGAPPAISQAEGANLKRIIKHLNNINKQFDNQSTASELFQAILETWDKVQDKWIRENVTSISKFYSQINSIIKNAIQGYTEVQEIEDRFNQY